MTGKVTNDQLPLEGVRVTDFCHVWAGPHVTQWLSVMGADVLKIETTLRPDLTRSFFADGRTLMPGLNRSVDFAVLNYSKKSCTINMTLPQGRDLARQLVRLSDVVTENFGGPVMERWGLAYPRLKELKPDIIMYSGSGFGRTGPYSGFPAYAPIIDAFAGLMALNGYVGADPTPFGVGGWTDLTAAQHGAFAILAALYHRWLTGEGQYIDLSMTEVDCAFLADAIIDYTLNGRVSGPQGNRDVAMAPHGCYRCKGEDRWVAIAVSGDDEWRAFCQAIGEPQWVTDERFRSALARWQNQDELDRLVTDWTQEHTDREVTDILQSAGVSCGPSLSPQEVVQDPQLGERGFFVNIDQAEMGTLQLARLPWSLRDGPAGRYEHAPAIGEHNDYVLKGLLDLSDEEILRLQEEQVIL